ncbi:MAG: sulfotransferase [Sneathiellales bacterium]|nr:sulfotransferase [Sneathiellales bacterium]
MTEKKARIARFEITARNKKAVHAYPRFTDFSARFDQYLEPQELLKTEGLSLYCYDQDPANVLFVDETDIEILKDSPFIYQRQYERARHLYRVPLSMLEKPDEDKTKRIFVFSTGRCGSTLLSNLMRLVPNGMTLSEPDYFYLLVRQFYQHWPDIKDPVEDLKKLVPNLVLDKGPVGTPIQIYKLRSQCVLIADKIRTAFPDAHFVFMHREAGGWFTSISKAFGQNLPAYIDRWKMFHAAFETQKRNGVAFSLFDYDALLKDPVSCFNTLLKECDLAFQATEDDIRSVLAEGFPGRYSIG